MTKPIKIGQMLTNCFYCYVLVSAVALLFIPFLFLDTGVGIADVYHIDDETLKERLAQFEGFMHDEIMGTKKYLRDFSQGNPRYYINAKTGTFGTNDMRGISLSASFKLFNKEISVEASRNSDDVLNRTY